MAACNRDRTSSRRWRAVPAPASSGKPIFTPWRLPARRESVELLTSSVASLRSAWRFVDCPTCSESIARFCAELVVRGKNWSKEEGSRVAQFGCPQVAQFQVSLTDIRDRSTGSPSRQFDLGSPKRYARNF